MSANSPAGTTRTGIARRAALAYLPPFVVAASLFAWAAASAGAPLWLPGGYVPIPALLSWMIASGRIGRSPINTIMYLVTALLALVIGVTTTCIWIAGSLRAAWQVGGVVMWLALLQVCLYLTWLVGALGTQRAFEGARDKLWKFTVSGWLGVAVGTTFVLYGLAAGGLTIAFGLTWGLPIIAISFGSMALNGGSRKRGLGAALAMILHCSGLAFVLLAIAAGLVDNADDNPMLVALAIVLSALAAVGLVRTVSSLLGAARRRGRDPGTDPGVDRP